MEKKEYLNNQTKELEERREKSQIALNEVQWDGISYEVVPKLLNQFNVLLNKCKDNAEKKILLQIIIKQITIDKARSIESIQLHLNDNLIHFLKSSQEGVSKTDTPSILCTKLRGIGRWI